MIRPVLVVLCALAASAAVAVLFVLWFAGGPRPAEDARPTGTPPASSEAKPLDSGKPAAPAPLTDLDAIDATLPAGFKAIVYVDEVDHPTSLAVAPNGTVFLGARAPGGGGAVYRFGDADGNGRLDDPTVFAQGLADVTGVLVRGGTLYVASRGAVSAFRDTSGDGVADERKDIVKNLPVPQEPLTFSNNGLALGPDGRLYFGMGATCNACVEENPWSATVLRCAPKGGRCDVFASGLRDVYDVAFNPVDGTLFAADIGALGIGGGTLEVQDEVNAIVKGADYGWPFCWGIGKGFDCVGTVPAVAELPPGSTPAGLAFYTGDAFPVAYRNNLFVALSGDMGRRVVRVVLTKADAGSFRAQVLPFALMNRPVDVVTAPDGSLLVADTGAGRVYRISYAPETS